MSPSATDALAGFAYSHWSHNPRKGGSLESALEDMVSEGIASVIRTSTLTATSTTATSSTATATTLTSTSTRGALTAPLSSGVETTGQDWSSSLWSACEAVVVSCLAMAASFVVIWSFGRCSRSKKEGKALPSATSQVRDLEASEVPAVPETLRHQASL